MTYLRPSTFSFFLAASQQSPHHEGAKKNAANPVGFRGQFRSLFALFSFSTYLKSRAIRPWPLPTMGSGT
jgi:hypothetical protein